MSAEALLEEELAAGGKLHPWCLLVSHVKERARGSGSAGADLEEAAGCGGGAARRSARTVAHSVLVPGLLRRVRVQAREFRFLERRPGEVCYHSFFCCLRIQRYLSRARVTYAASSKRTSPNEASHTAQRCCHPSLHAHVHARARIGARYCRCRRWRRCRRCHRKKDPAAQRDRGFAFAYHSTPSYRTPPPASPTLVAPPPPPAALRAALA